LLEGLILQRVTGETVAQFTQDTLWQPMGMEYPASWSLDSTTDGFEKTNSALNARAIDFARFGLLFLNQGRWNGQQILSRQWVTASTTPDSADHRSWTGDDANWLQAGGYYKYGWWGLNNPDGTYDYLASGKQNQIIFVSPSTSTVVVGLGIGLLVLFRERLNHQGRLARSLAGSVYTVYLIHPVVLVGFAYAFHVVALYPLLKWAIAVLITIPLCFLLSLLIRKIPLVNRVV